MPKDKFKREREYRERSARQFDNLLRKIIRRNPTSYDLLERYGKPVKKMNLPTKTFNCDCGQEIIATGEGRTARERVRCSNCGKIYKLHPDYAESKGEIIFFARVMVPP